MKSFAFAAFVASAAAVPAWSDWAAESASSSTPVKITSTTSSTPVKITSTSYTDPEHTWEDWSSTTSSTPAKETSSSYDPEHTWSDWAASTSTPADSYTTTVVTAIETYCPYATEFVHAGKTYSVTEATTVTITDCPCTISVPVVTKTTSSCADYEPTPGYWNPVAPAETPDAASAPANYGAASGTGAYPVSPYATTSAPIAAYTGAANRVANVGAGLAGVAAAAAFLL